MYWAEGSPHEIREYRFQYQFSLNVWVGIVGGFLIEPVILPKKLTTEVYCNSSEDRLLRLLVNIPLATRKVILYMHDGTPAYFSRLACGSLNATYRWIGRGGLHAWPVRSPDLNLVDFFMEPFKIFILSDASGK